jgi:hypothetical protein
VIFIPPHLVEEVIAHANDERALDDWRIMRLLEGKYRARQVYGVAIGHQGKPGDKRRGGIELPAATPEIERDYQEWRKENKR